MKKIKILATVFITFSICFLLTNACSASISASPSSANSTSPVNVRVSYSPPHDTVIFQHLNYFWDENSKQPNLIAGNWGSKVSSKSFTTRSPQGKWYLHVRATYKVKDRGHYTTGRTARTYGLYNIGSGGGSGGGPGDGSGGGIIAPPPPPPPKPSISANPSSRGWSQSNVSVSLSFRNTSSQRAKWSNGSWTSSSSSSSRTMTIKQSGSWTLYAEASGSGGSTSRSFGSYKIDKVPPTITFIPGSGAGFENVARVTLKFRDAHSGVKRVRWMWSKELERPTDWSWKSRSGNSVNEVVTHDVKGVWFLHAEVEDGVGLTDYVCAGPYLIMGDLIKPDANMDVRLVE